MYSTEEQGGHWGTQACTLRNFVICEKDAVPGHVPKPTPTPNPEFSKCDEGWFYIYSTQNCYYIDHFFSSTWDASESHCAGKGAHLMSINDPKTQELILTFTNDPDAIGIIFNFLQTRKLLIFNVSSKKPSLG